MLLKQEHGENFRDYLQMFQIARAKKFMLAGGVSVTDVCFAVGFNDASHFARRFKVHVGVTPAEFLRQIKKNDERLPKYVGNETVGHF